MLERLDSRELSEWKAFERAFGPVGNEYRDEALASIQETSYFHAYVSGAQYEENPVPEPKPYLRPPEWFERHGRDRREDDDVVTQEQFDKFFQ